MGRETGRLVPAPDVQSVMLRGGAPKTSEGPARHSGWQSRCYQHLDARPADTTPLATNEGADMAKSTRGLAPSDSETQDSAVNITPASSTATVPTTPSIA